MITNLSQLKKALVKEMEFEVIALCRTEVVGERRMVNYANTVGFYSIIPSKPDSKANNANGGKGSFLGWSKAAFWEFKDGVCTLYSDINKTLGSLTIAIKPI